MRALRALNRLAGAFTVVRKGMWRSWVARERGFASMECSLPTPIGLVRTVHDLNEALTVAGHPERVRIDDAWTEAVHDYGFRTAYEIALDGEAAQERASARAKRERAKKGRRR